MLESFRRMHKLEASKPGDSMLNAHSFLVQLKHFSGLRPSMPWNKGRLTNGWGNNPFELNFLQVQKISCCKVKENQVTILKMLKGSWRIPRACGHLLLTFQHPIFRQNHCVKKVMSWFWWKAPKTTTHGNVTSAKKRTRTLRRRSVKKSNLGDALKTSELTRAKTRLDGLQ